MGRTMVVVEVVVVVEGKWEGPWELKRSLCTEPTTLPQTQKRAWFTNQAHTLNKVAIGAHIIDQY